MLVGRAVSFGTKSPKTSGQTGWVRPPEDGLDLTPVKPMGPPLAAVGRGLSAIGQLPDATLALSVGEF